MEEKNDPTLTLDELKVQTRKSNKNPNIENTTQVALKDGPRCYNIATLFEILCRLSKKLSQSKLCVFYFRTGEL
jgi:hypothetical protein